LFRRPVKAEQFGNRAEYFQACILHDTREPMGRAAAPLKFGIRTSINDTLERHFREPSFMDLPQQAATTAARPLAGSSRDFSSRNGKSRLRRGPRVVGAGAGDSNHLSPISQNRR
jgi:hypothetical protein